MTVQAPRRPPPHGRVSGFTIIEIMIGLAIGLLTLLAIYQLFATSEGRRRSTAAVSQAQTAGALALFAIERDIRSAGLGFAGLESAYLGCAVQAYKRSDRNPASYTFPLVPVEIIGGKELRVLTGSSANMFIGARYSASASGVFTMERSNAGFQAGDVVVGTSDSDASKCLLMEITAGAGSSITGPGGVAEDDPSVRHMSSAYTSFYTGASVTPERNGGSSVDMLDGGATSLGEGWLFSLGHQPTRNVWRVKDNQLMRYNFLDEADTKSVAVAEDVLQMVAEYGFDKDGSGKIDKDDEWTSSDAALVAPNLGRLMAVRVAILVRSSQYEREPVTAAAPRWANGSKSFDMGSEEDWKHFRYRVYESAIPLRNTIWGQQQ
ncbi:PilW family protein [Comamonas sp. JUb58]|uniref:PilW family protein n=1 Tax=Comamonas sp. JUb58 TaxID=2485114 RepID=UPI00105DB7AE|nr:PilW family protein [Comamonas sp. JUb58]TDS76710.1 type IV pilus assembly protein PilW [Comamonas sp. JUb58]